MDQVVPAVIGMALAILLTVGFAAIKVSSGDRTIQPEGERDPGTYGWPAHANRQSSERNEPAAPGS